MSSRQPSYSRLSLVGVLLVLTAGAVAATFTVMIEFLISPYSGALVINEDPDAF